jgi:hypothetical protein
MKKFEVEFNRVLGASRVLLEILRNEASNMSGVIIENVYRIVVPETAKSLRAFYTPIFGSEFKGKDIITAEDFNRFEVVNIDRSRFSISLHSNNEIYIHLTMGQEWPYTIGEVSFYTLNGLFYFYYNEFPEGLPFNLTNRKDVNFFYMLNRISDITRLAIATVSLIYTLYNFKESFQVKGKYPEDIPVASNYVHSIKEKIRALGDNFVEVIEKLGAFSIFM